jgi:hypothetical protein
MPLPRADGPLPIALPVLGLGAGLGWAWGASESGAARHLAGGLVVAGGCAVALVLRLRRPRRRGAGGALPPVRRRSLAGQEALDEVNRMSASGESEFRVLAEGGGRLVLMGSFDLDYYHDVEVTFHDVRSCGDPAELHAPGELRWPQLHDAGPAGETRRRCVIEDDGGRHVVVAGGVSAEVGKVYPYDRGRELRPGERIAPWVRRRRERPRTSPAPTDPSRTHGDG